MLLHILYHSAHTHLLLLRLSKIPSGQDILHHTYLKPTTEKKNPHLLLKVKDTSSLQFQNSFSVNMLLSVCVYSKILMARKKEAPKEEWGCWKKQDLHKEKHRNGGLGYVSGKNNIRRGLLSLYCGLRVFLLCQLIAYTLYLKFGKLILKLNGNEKGQE